MYQFIEHSNWEDFSDCNYSPIPRMTGWYVTFWPSEGTVHEAFFDPATSTIGELGFSLGATTTGVLDPREFTVDTTEITISRLHWIDGNVTMALSPFVPLDGNTLDFIGVDGNTVLTLYASDAERDASNGTLSWPVEDAPWGESDKLMLRIRRDED